MTEEEVRRQAIIRYTNGEKPKSIYSELGRTCYPRVEYSRAGIIKDTICIFGPDRIISPYYIMVSIFLSKPTVTPNHPIPICHYSRSGAK